MSPGHEAPGARNMRMTSTNPRQSSAAVDGTLNDASATDGSDELSSASCTLIAVACPMPGTSRAARKPANRLRGFSAQRRMDRTSFT